jgi:hypothetical protein
MKALLILTSLLSPVAAAAQGVEQLKTIGPQLKTTTVEQPLQGSANMHGFKLATSSFLYRNLTDTLNNRYAHRLRLGDHVVIRNTLPNWYKVYRAKNASQFSNDTTTYYMPKAAAAGAIVFILL